jgi:hypothetical protein
MESDLVTIATRWLDAHLGDQRHYEGVLVEIVAPLLADAGHTDLGSALIVQPTFRPGPFAVWADRDHGPAVIYCEPQEEEHAPEARD